MDPYTIGLLGSIGFVLLVVMGVPIAFSSAFIGFAGLLALKGWHTATQVIGYLPHPFITHYSLTVIPLFILMGHFATYGGLTGNFFAAARAWLGHIRGGLAISTVFTCAGFAACTGSSIASAAIMSNIAVPEMRKHGYNPILATGVVAAGGTLAILIPPSTTIVLYGFLTEQSIGTLLLAGFVPGIVTTIIYTIGIYILCRLNPSWAPVSARAALQTKIASLKEIWVIFVVVFLIIGGLYSGVFTPTEVGAIAAFIFFVFALITRRLTRANLNEGLLQTGHTACMIFLIIVGILLFTNFLAMSGVVRLMIDGFVGLQISRYVKLIMILLIYVILGMFMEIVGMLALSLPVVFPVILKLGFDPIWFGIIVVKMAEICLLTPPVGLNVYVVHGAIPDVPMQTIFKGVMPFLLMEAVALTLFIVFPEIIIFVPSLMKH